ncbi:hypothetical protein KC343_g11015 [Hortaea werneckii]|uniref:ABM domain-containing protein n=2 Tax=Hortaea werneckii TaxID=91943 RepID=A0A3M7HFW7_HORWE|nr:hypothetical protein KC352_g25972 [Hortaea werneckii]KAI7558107.1 hypothetical protein KC317_g11211 [Hortaea werneckii]KAI7605593.1 hypothetical protein KC346_g10948 [Hortaea werneckii]KAI7613063.1 hypothetical protein KC343_g11015 [Hortaea werneckii]KAI7651808.1 hypothetical protein KC319_g10806 [Hortaea werneckii]
MVNYYIDFFATSEAGVDLGSAVGRVLTASTPSPSSSNKAFSNFDSVDWVFNIVSNSKMASKEFNVIAILHPKKGKTDIVLRQLNEVAEYVQKNEPGVLSYSINRSLRPSKDGEEEIIMLERYKDQAALKEHGSSQTFTAFNKKLAEQDLMRAPMVLKMVGEQGGFRSRL